MFDGTRVILDAYGRLLKKNNNVFRNNFRRGEVYNNGTRGIDCRRQPIVPWEHGEKIYKAIKQVCMTMNLSSTCFEHTSFFLKSVDNASFIDRTPKNSYYTCYSRYCCCIMESLLDAELVNKF